MPQMAPISWLTLYILFTITLIMFCILNYYSFSPSINKKSLNKSNISLPLNWKW
nr:ATP synthase F0 subunit 8 [Argyra sp.]